MRFLNNANGGKEPSQSILDVGVEKALNETYFDQKAFKERDGHYEKTVLSQTKKKHKCGSLDLKW